MTQKLAPKMTPNSTPKRLQTALHVLLHAVLFITLGSMAVKSVIYVLSPCTVLYFCLYVFINGKARA